MRINLVDVVAEQRDEEQMQQYLDSQQHAKAVWNMSHRRCWCGKILRSDNKSGVCADHCETNLRHRIARKTNNR